MSINIKRKYIFSIYSLNKVGNMGTDLSRRLN